VFSKVFADRITYHEITLDELQLIGQTLLLSISCGTLNLVVIVVQSGNVCSGELGDLSGGTSYTASNIQHFVTILDTDFRGEVVFVTGNGLVERFTVGKSTEMERLTPSVFVKIGGKVVVTVCGLAYRSFASECQWQVELTVLSR
jgi:hypothetical protein